VLLFKMGKARRVPRMRACCACCVPRQALIAAAMRARLCVSRAAQFYEMFEMDAHVGAAVLGHAINPSSAKKKCLTVFSLSCWFFPFLLGSPT
jgi:hypothetical protein